MLPVPLALVPYLAVLGVVTFLVTESESCALDFTERGPCLGFWKLLFR